MKVTLFVPVLNEIEGLKAIMPLVKREWVDQILVVDGGSTDGSVEWCKAQGYDIVKQKRKGLRLAYSEGMPYATGEAVIAFSPDGNSLPEAIPVLIQKMNEGYDLVIASRYLMKAESTDDSWLTGFGNWFFNTLFRSLYRVPLTDVMVMYRIFRKSHFFNLDIDKDESYALPEKCLNTIVCIVPLMIARTVLAGHRVTEVPFDEPARIGGRSKLQVVRWGLSYLFQYVYEWIRGPRDYPIRAPSVVQGSPSQIRSQVTIGG